MSSDTDDPPLPERSEIPLASASDLSHVEECAQSLKAKTSVCVTDKGSEMLSAFEDIGVVNCVDHLLKNVVDRTMLKPPFFAPLKKARAAMGHILSGLLTQIQLNELQELLIAHPKHPQRFCQTRWTGWHEATEWTVVNFSPIVAYQMDDLPGRRDPAKLKRLRDSMDLAEEDYLVLCDLLPVAEVLKSFSVILQATSAPTIHLLWPMLASLIEQLIDFGEEGVRNPDGQIERSLREEVAAAVLDLAEDIKRSFQWSEGTWTRETSMN
eukprot:GHVU01066624.1.p1 GENE.GHVU01066624.1~~GHVU01066624.1.p1  ORF type:complete len:268 (-),score=45.63 GHVU01066624.1:1277-2080(-)